MTTQTAESPWPEALHQAWKDLQPFPGRFGLTWRVALLCAIVTATAMILKIPEAAISCYLVIFLMKEDAVQNCIMAVGLILLATTVVALMIPIINLGIDSAAIRLAVMFFASFIFLFLSSTTPLGEQAAIVGLIIAFIMTLVTDVPIGQIGDQGLLMAWKMASMPMFLMFLFNLLLGIPAQTHVKTTVAERLRTSADRVLSAAPNERLTELLGDGNDLHLQRMMTVKLLHLVPAARSTWLNGSVETSYRILVAADALGPSVSEARRQDLAQRLRSAADAIDAGKVPATIAPTTSSEDAADAALDHALADLTSADGGGSPKPRKIPLLAADAFTNPRHTRFALKTSIAAVLCYLIYTALQWDGIHTAMITCYVAALGTLGETVRKLTLRIVGCLIGAAMGAAALFLVMPHLTSVGGIMGLVFAGTLVGAWVSSGNERIAYVGVQIALAFLLTTVNGFGPSYEFAQASNRIAGILLGIFVIYVIFTQFWPQSVIGDIRDRIVEALDALARLAQAEAGDLRTRTEAISTAQIAIARAEELLDIAQFEPRANRADFADLDAITQYVEGLRRLSIQLQFAEDATNPSLEEIRRLRDELAADNVAGSSQASALLQVLSSCNSGTRSILAE
jgi:multidrug resistance protein MdtO